MNMALICMGRLKEKYWRDAAAEYEKRLSRFGKWETIELPDLPEPSNSSPAIEEQIKKKEGEAILAKLREGGLQTTDCEAIEAGFTLREIEVDGKPYRGAVVENIKTGVRTFYEVDDQTTYWTIWNNGGQVNYCCPEPQSWTTNAPNAADPQAAGFRYIEPDKKWKAVYKLYAK